MGTQSSRRYVVTISTCCAKLVNWSLVACWYDWQDTISVHRPGFYSQRFQIFFSNTVFKKIPSRMQLSCLLITLVNNSYSNYSLEHRFSASMTAYSVGWFSELEMSSFGSYAVVKMHSPSIALSTARCWSHTKCPTVHQRCKLVIGTGAAGLGSK